MSREDALSWTIDIVPNGNLVLVLSNLEAYHGDVLKVFDAAITSKEKSSVWKLPKLEAPSQATSLEIVRRTDAKSNKPTTLWSSERVYCERNPSDDNSASIRVRVSSDQLSRVSSVFELFTRPTGDVGHFLSENGEAELPLPDDDAAAMLMILLVIFNRPNKVPRTVSVDMLASISILIDKYGLQSPLSFHTQIWFEALLPEFPVTMNASYMTWLCIAYNIGERSGLRHLVSVATYYAEGPLDSGMLPIPQSVLDGIESDRVDKLAYYRAVFTNIIHEYTSGERKCRRNDKFCVYANVGILVCNKAQLDSIGGETGIDVSCDRLKQEVSKMVWPNYTYAPGKQCCEDILKKEIETRFGIR